VVKVVGNSVAGIEGRSVEPRDGTGAGTGAVGGGDGAVD